ncbi:MAG TPA: MarR family transcriptional regulator [Candidatus Limnocylindria bacterium]|nr:MarR family transcriptional regulator [Candidatus Limnocylindria bacterium]
MTTQSIPKQRQKRRLKPDELRAWLAFIRAGLYSLRAMDRDAEASGRPPFSEHHILATLDGGPPEGIRPTDLAERAALTKSGLTRAIDRLESQGLIARRPCPTDARGQLIVLSAQGRRVLRRSAPEHFRSIARNFADHLTDRETPVVTAALERVADAAARR